MRSSPGTCFTFLLLQNKIKPAVTKKEDFSLKGGLANGLIIVN